MDSLPRLRMRVHFDTVHRMNETVTIVYEIFRETQQKEILPVKGYSSSKTKVCESMIKLTERH